MSPLRPISLGLTALLFAAYPLQAIRPVYHYYALVAGEGSPGYADGSFDQALFNGPQGLTQSSDGKLLFVADTGNNRIRVIDLSNNNQVSTIAGTGQLGKLDGSALKATFSQPTALVTLRDGRIVVNDQGNGLLRVIDLKKQVVSTFASESDRGEMPRVFTGSISHLLYVESENTLYFSQPDFGLLQKIDLTTKTEVTLLKSDPRVPNPWALGFYGGKLYLADRGLTQIYRVDGAPSGDPEKPAAPLTEVANATRTLAFAADPDGLYALEQDRVSPLIKVAPSNEPVVQVSVWGDSLDDRSDTVFSENYFWGQVGFQADRRGNHNFFVTNPTHHLIGSFRDLSFKAQLNSELTNEGGTTDFPYPYQKPPRTYRILTVGDSRSFHTTNLDHKRHGLDEHNRMEILPKRLELLLNTWAALEDVTMNYEVIHLGRASWDPLVFWPIHQVPGLVKKYDIDMVLWLIPPGNYTAAYFERPLNADGLPSTEIDPEYALKSLDERVPPGDPALLFKLCKEQHLENFFVSRSGDFTDFDGVSMNPVIRPVLDRLVSKPITFLKTALDKIKTTTGHKVQLGICFLPLGGIRPQQVYEHFWEKLCKDQSIAFLGLNRQLTVLRPTLSPLSEIGGNDHFDANGHLILGLLLARELVFQKAIPFPRK